MEARTIVPSRPRRPHGVVAEEPASTAQRSQGEVVFSSPTNGETNVPVAAPIRLQFSRGIDPLTPTNRLRVGVHRGGAVPSPEASATIGRPNVLRRRHASVSCASKP